MFFTGTAKKRPEFKYKERYGVSHKARISLLYYSVYIIASLKRPDKTDTEGAFKVFAEK